MYYKINNLLRKRKRKATLSISLILQNEKLGAKLIIFL